MYICMWRQTWFIRSFDHACMQPTHIFIYIDYNTIHAAAVVFALELLQRCCSCHPKEPLLLCTHSFTYILRIYSHKFSSGCGVVCACSLDYVPVHTTATTVNLHGAGAGWSAAPAIRTKIKPTKTGMIPTTWWKDSLFIYYQQQDAMEIPQADRQCHVWNIRTFVIFFGCEAAGIARCQNVTFAAAQSL